jgi:hypothetical protein
MTRKERIECAIERGYTYNPHTGKIYGIKGKEITNLNNGYIMFSFKIDEKQYSIYGHQFAYYWVHKEIVEQVDHINGIKDDNRIENLRSVTNQENQWNQRKAKGYYWNKKANKYKSQIKVDGVKKYLGLYDKEEDARQAYLDAKKIYHQIG